eukprot:505503-Hanusia_phi.AAC.2
MALARDVTAFSSIDGHQNDDRKLQDQRPHYKSVLLCEAHSGPPILCMQDRQRGPDESFLVHRMYVTRSSPGRTRSSDDPRLLRRTTARTQGQPLHAFAPHPAFKVTELSADKKEFVIKALTSCRLAWPPSSSSSHSLSSALPLLSAQLLHRCLIFKPPPNPPVLIIVQAKVGSVPVVFPHGEDRRGKEAGESVTLAVMEENELNRKELPADIQILNPVFMN